MALSYRSISRSRSGGRRGRRYHRGGAGASNYVSNLVGSLNQQTQNSLYQNGITGASQSTNIVGVNGSKIVGGRRRRTHRRHRRRGGNLSNLIVPATLAGAIALTKKYKKKR